jgi:hypothetical protein
VAAIIGAPDRILTRFPKETSSLDWSIGEVVTREVPEKKKEHRNCPVRSIGYGIFFREVPEKNIEDQTALELSDEGTGESTRGTMSNSRL